VSALHVSLYDELVAKPARPTRPDLDGLLCALILVPQSYSRNRFFRLFEDHEARRARRRASRVRGVIRQLTAGKAEILGEQVLDDGQVLLRYRIADLAFERTTALSQLEAAALRCALHRAGVGQLEDSDRELVTEALRRLGADLPLVA
jgi:hypothetical protein